MHAFYAVTKNLYAFVEFLSLGYGQNGETRESTVIYSRRDHRECAFRQHLTSKLLDNQFKSMDKFWHNTGCLFLINIASRVARWRDDLAVANTDN